MSINLEKTDLSFEDLKNKPYYPKELEKSIEESNAIILPFENFRENKPALFPEITDDFFAYLECNKNDLFKPNILISEDKFEKLEMHCDWLNFGRIILELAVLPIFINLLSNFIYDKIQKNKLKEDSTVEIEINVVETKAKKTTKITYKGSSKDVKKALNDITNKL